MLKILIVEDSLLVQRRLTDLLLPTVGIELVGCAETAAEALDLAGRRYPDLMILDVELRDGDRGITVLRRMAQTCPTCEVVVLSNFTWSAMRDGFLQAGARAYFDKAFEFTKARDWILARAAGRHAP